MTNKIYIFTFSRSDYASIKPVIKKLSKSKYNFVVGGSHLSKQFGYTIDEIIRDNFKIDFKIEYLKKNFISKSKKQNLLYSHMIKFFDNFFKKNKVKKIFIVGDRWELIPLVLSAFNLNIKIIHHSGGDYTLGSKDNFYRNIISILSNFHLVGNVLHKKRLMLLGIEKSLIKVVGEPSIQNEVYKFNKKKNFVLATLYPSDFEEINYNMQISNFLKFLKKLDDKIILTLPSIEAGSEFFIKKIKKLKSKKIEVINSLGADKYNYYMSQAKLIIGNSSSGIIEASTYKKPVINIGNRQTGRLRCKNVIDCGYQINNLISAYKKVNSKAFLDSIKNIKNPYQDKNSVQKIIRVILKKRIKNKYYLVDPLKYLNELS